MGGTRVLHMRYTCDLQLVHRSNNVRSRGFDIRPSGRGHLCVSQNRLDHEIVNPEGLQIHRESTPVCVPAILRQSRFLKFRTDHSLCKGCADQEIKSYDYCVRKQPWRSRIALGLGSIEQKTQRLHDRYDARLVFLFSGLFLRSLCFYHSSPYRTTNAQYMTFVVRGPQSANLALAQPCKAATPITARTTAGASSGRNMLPSCCSMAMLPTWNNAQ
jgi:hypothetical protein